MRKAGIALLVIVLALVSLLGGAGTARAGVTASRQVIVVLIDKVTWADIQEARAPFIKGLARRGEIGLMSAHTAVSQTTTRRSYVTISAGNRAVATAAAGVALSAGEKFEGEKARVLFRRLVGARPGNAEVLHLGLPPQDRVNVDLGNNAFPGALGDTIRKAGLKTAVLGNADTSKKDEFYREAAVIAADREGRVDFGDVSRRLLETDELSPFGLRTDYERLVGDFQRVKAAASLIVIETGDSRRADAFQRFASVPVSKRNKLAAIERADRFLRRMFQFIEPSRDIVAIVSPSPPEGPDGRTTQQLLPIIVAGGSKEPVPALLTSGLTRRPGLVTSVDLAPTILDALGLERPYYFSGTPMTGIADPPRGTDGGGRIAGLAAQNNDFIFADRHSALTNISFLVLQIIALLVGLMILLGNINLSPAGGRAVRGLMLFVLALPLAIFTAPMLQSSYRSTAAYVFVGLAIAAGAAAIASVLSRDKRLMPLLILSAGTTVFLLVNAFLGGRVDLYASLGYSPIVAGRFYGIGNQAMSVLVTTAIMGAALLLQRGLDVEGRARWFVLGFFLLVTAVIGYPALGANTGGTLTAAVAFGAVYVHMFHRDIRRHQLALVGGSAVALLALFVAADVYLLPVKTHMARAFMLVQQGGWAEFTELAGRKWAANVRIFRYTSWSYLALTLLGVLVFVRFLQPKTAEPEFFGRYPYLSSGLVGALIGGLAGAVTNDSGISIPALMVAYMFVAMFYLMVVDRERTEP